MQRDSLPAVCVFATAFVLAIAGCDNGKRAMIEKTQAQVRRIVQDLDQRTTETGVYVRAKEDEIKESDPWGTPIQCSYSQGGIAESVSVRSAGPDREFHTDDDIVAGGMSTNLKGLGEGIKKNAETTAANAAKGLVKGAVEGAKESVKEALPFRKKKDAQSDSKTDNAIEDKSQPVDGHPAN